MAYEPALESIFANAEQQAAGLLETITTAINSKVTTIEAGEKLVLALSEEAAKFNQMLVDLDNIKSQIESGDMSKEDGLASVKPIVAELKANCQALKLSNAELSDSEDIDVAEIAVLREIIAGAKSAAEARVVELRTSGEEADTTDAPAQGGVLESLMNLEVAEEGIEDLISGGASVAGAIAKKMADPKQQVEKALRNSTEAKTAATLKTNAKKLYSMGSKEKAQEYMKKAQDLYEKLAEKAKKNCGFYEVERTTTRMGVTDKYKTQAAKNRCSLETVSYFESLADSCKAYLLQWQNKAGNASLAETKAQLKAERKAERARIRAEKKKRKATESADFSEDLCDSDKEYMSELSATEVAICEAMESYADQIEMLELSAAFESDTDGEKKGILARIRAAFGKLRRKDKSGVNEANDAMNDLVSEAKDAEERGDKKGIIKIVLICAAILALIVTIIALFVKYENSHIDKRLYSEAAAAAKKMRSDAARASKMEDVKGAKGLALQAAQLTSNMWAKVRGGVTSALDTAAAASRNREDSRGTSYHKDNIKNARDTLIQDEIGSESMTALESMGSTIMDMAVAMEGINNDARKLKKSYTKEIRGYAKDAKHAYKNGNFNDAKRNYLKAAEVADALVKEIQDLPNGNANSVMIGNLLHSLRGGYGGLVYGGVEDVKRVDTALNEIDRYINQANKAGASELKHNDLNRYLEQMIKWGKAMAEGYRKLAAKASKAGGLDAASESLDLNSLMVDLGLATESTNDDLSEDEEEVTLEAAVSLMLAEDNLDD